MTEPTLSITDFITRWQQSSASERANCQSFLNELCEILEVPKPQPAQNHPELDAYVYERSVTFHHTEHQQVITTNGWIDLYKRGCFVLEAKQGSSRDGGNEGRGEGATLFEGIGKGKSRKKGTAVRGTKAWDDAMLRARGQAERYAKALPTSEGWPPFLITVDIGHSFELYSDFSRAGKTYLPFPDAQSSRIAFADLAKPEIRERLKAVWTDPLSLDPSRRSARVTREVAARLAALAKSLEESGHKPETVAAFLMRCLFTMFAEDVQLIPAGKFTALLESRRDKLQNFKPMLESLWRTMNTGGFSEFLDSQVLRFNGGLFETSEALPVTRPQLDLLIEASHSDWREVEPAIFGTLLERALSPVERHKLGAHYTPRAYVERLVMPTVIEPLREEWQAVLAAAITLANAGKLEDAAEAVKDFHQHLCEVRVLDPACGSGNFLYVTLEHLKRLEGEVINALNDFDARQAAFEIEGWTVDPHQLLGLEVNPRAAAIADLVLWIGYLQWHFRTRGDAKPAEPVLRKFRNIECRDAVLAYDVVEIVTGEDGQPVTRWDGRTMKTHPVTGEAVPDDTARVPQYRYLNARKAEWPAADYVVGNPPFIGTARMRSALGDGYTETLRGVYGDIPESCDYVMYWWDKAAELARRGQIKRFGLITTNSLRQTFNRRVIQKYLDGKEPLSLLFAIPDHPWVDSADGAAVRISMTVGEAGEHDGALLRVTSETGNNPEAIAAELADIASADRLSSLRQERNVYSQEQKSDSQLRQERNVADAAPDGAEREMDTRLAINISPLSGLQFTIQRGRIFADLTIGANVAAAQPLQANAGLSSRGVQLIGAGFIVTPDEASQLGLGRIAGLEKHIRLYRNGRDLTGSPRNVMVIDLFGLTADEVRKRFQEVYQWVYERVKPERDQNNRASYKNNWWIHGEPRGNFRPALNGLQRYIATVETSKHRFFVFLDESILPDNKLINFAFDDAYFLGVMSSRFHVAWALAAGSKLGVGNDPVYVKTACFEKFPFPDCTADQQAKIRALGEQLDAHRKRQQALHPDLTLTEMYNVLEKLRSGESLSAKEQATHERGLVSVLRQIHDELDAAVAEAYGWPATISDEEILQRLVALNAERAREEQSGLIRWLRPEYQKPAGVQTALVPEDAEAVPTITKSKTAKLAWPKTLAEQARAIRSALTDEAVTADQLAKAFVRGRAEAVESLLETLVSLGLAREVEEGKFAA